MYKFLFFVIVVLFMSSCTKSPKPVQEDEVISIPFITEENRGGLNEK